MAHAIALDSCVVIRLMEQPGLAGRLRAKIRGTYTRIVIPDVVLREVRRVRGYSEHVVKSRMAATLGKKVSVVTADGSHRARAREISSRFEICHSGDNLILALCGSCGFTLVTLDRMLLQASEFAGIPAFHPFRTRVF